MLEVRGLQVAYGDRRVLRGIDLNLSAGEVVGLIGPNGCGKTTILRAITGALPLAGGEVRINGEPVASMDTRQLARRVAVVPQNPRLPTGFTALDVVLMGRTAHLGFFQQEGRADIEASEQALAQVDALHLAARPVDELSGGERQNVVIARALAQAAPLLLLDEPTANLDIGHQMAVARLMRRLARDRDLGVLAAVHDLTLASLYCDRLVLMQQGWVVAEGSAHEVLTRENIEAAYGADVMVLPLEGGVGPVVLPIRPAKAEG